MKFKTLIAGLALSLTPLAAIAQTALLDFSSSMYSFSADFTQTVYDSDSVALQESAGSVELMRPGRFRWTYTEPASQVIVADGLSLWVYDEDIKQVTVQPQSTTLGSAPIGLLSGQRSIETEFNVKVLGEEKGLQWFELTPMEQDTDFNTVYIALDESGLHAMELRDNFDQATQIKFTNFKKNVAIDARRFAFVPPEGADVIGEEGQQQDEVPAIREIGDDEVLDDSQVKSATLPDLPEIEKTEEPVTEDDGLPPIAETLPVTESNSIIDGNQLQFEEVTE